ncbi:MAG TPA: ATP synthase subunit I [Pseudomonadales bacterium]|nr:ATP synthase subunit I [Pseudomonadales bacterium]
MADERPQAMPLEYRVVLLQVLVVVTTAAGLGIAGGDAASVLVGGACAVLPNAWMALRVRREAQAGREMAGAVGLFVAMLGKLALTVVLLALAIRLLPGFGPAGFFAGFIVGLLAHHASFFMKDASHEGLPPPRPEPDDDRDW